MTITELAIKRPPLIIVIFSVLAILGIFSYMQLKYELLPDITPPYVSVVTVYPGAAPQEVEQSVTKPVEDAVAGVDKLKSISSYSYENYSVVQMEFYYAADKAKATQDVQKKVNEVVASLPASAKQPVVSDFSFSDFPIMRIGLTSDMDPRQLFATAKDVVKPRLSRLAGVGQVTIIGGEEREIRVNLDLAKLSARGIPVPMVVAALKSANADLPAGKIQDADGEYLVRLSGKYSTIDELKRVSIARRGGTDLALSDFAEVEDGAKAPTSIGRINGKDALGISIVKQSGANAVEVSKEVRKELASIEKEYSGKKLSFDIAVDSSNFTMESARSVTHDLFLAICLVALVMLAFLHSIRGSLMVLVAIPLSIVSTFIGAWAFGMTLNLMTLLALSLIIGILVDDSIVVLENIYRHMEMGKPRRIAALDGRNEIGFSALSITMVDVVVFLPLSLISGMIGNLVRQYSLVVVIATLMSLFVSFTVTPMLASRFAKVGETKGKHPLAFFSKGFEAGFERLVRFYERVLGWSLRHKTRTIIGTFALFVGSIALLAVGIVSSEFVPPLDKGEISVQMTAPSRTSILEMNSYAARAERAIYAIPEVSKVFTTVGQSSGGQWGLGGGSNTAEIDVTLVPAAERKRSATVVSEQIKTIVKAMPGMQVNTSPIGIFGSGDSYSLGMIVKGVDRAKVQEAALQIEAAMKRVEGTGEVKISASEAQPIVDVRIDRKRLSELGLSIDGVGAQMSIALTGYEDLKLRDGASEYPMRIIADESQRDSTAGIGRMKFLTASGQEAELAQFSTITPSLGPSMLQREDRLPSVIVLSQAVGRPSGDIAADIKKQLKAIKFDDGVFVREVGDAEMQTEAFSNLALAVLAAIVFVYLVMVALYNSFVYPFIVLFSIPVAVVGALLALAITAKTLNIFSILGIIMLIGLVGKNAILLVDRANHNRQEGLDLVPALLEAGRTRLRPILMTTISMICGMSPIALATTGGGAEFKSSLGVVLIGGLASSLFLTLLLVPVVYALVEKLKERVLGLGRSRKLVLSDGSLPATGGGSNE
jgi:HAE1 family hydrophobic/amphiphilic exporter-1